MKIKGLIDEDFIQYKKPSMFIATSICSFKCDKEAGCQVCQNSDLATAPIINISAEEIIERYVNNPITEAVVIGGLEPFDDFNDLCELLGAFEKYYKTGHVHIKEKRPDIIIYTGYYPKEIRSKLRWMKEHKKDEQINIIIKFGRFIPDSMPIYDELLGVNLASCNQKAMKLESCFNETA